jgi:phage tail sheath gpL-like
MYGPGGVTMIERAISTYQFNQYSAADTSFLDVTTRYVLSYVKKSVGYLITQKFPRCKLAADSTLVGFGNALVTPKTIKNELIAWYSEMEQLGILQNTASFEEDVIVELNQTDSNRVDVVLPAIIVNNLIVAAVRVDLRFK